MSYWKYVLVVGFVMSTWAPGIAQFFVSSQLNTGLPVGNTREYGVPRMGYSAEVGYQPTDRWRATITYDFYSFEMGTDLNDLDLSPAISTFLNLPEAIALDLEVSSWNGGFRYSIPYLKVVPFFGLMASTNNIEVSGYGLTVSRRSWGAASVAGLEWPLAPRWSVQTSTRLHAIFIRESIPLVGEIIEENLVFVPIHLGIVFQLRPRQS